MHFIPVWLIVKRCLADGVTKTPRARDEYLAAISLIFSLFALLISGVGGSQPCQGTYYRLYLGKNSRNKIQAKIWWASCLEGLHGGSLMVISVACLFRPCDLILPLLAFLDQLLLICGSFVSFKAFLNIKTLTDPSKPEYCLGIVMYFSVFLLILSWVLIILFFLAIPTARCIICINERIRKRDHVDSSANGETQNQNLWVAFTQFSHLF